MIKSYLEEQIGQNLGFMPTIEQQQAISALANFILSKQNDDVFILRGYAGTGKTSLMGALVRTLGQLSLKTVLMAPTGRAAKVFSLYAGHVAYTIHKKIYRQKVFTGDGGNFLLNDNIHKHTLFIVDESSMIANDGFSGANFGTGRLLDDLVEYVYAGEGCRLLLVGDTAQLPPVGEEEGPALVSMQMAGYGLNVSEFDLTEVVRQLGDSGILWNATQLRHLIMVDNLYDLPTIRFSGFADVRNVSGNELIELLSECYSQVGLEETMVITRSNKRANIYNGGIRNQILYREEELSCGDVLMVAKNNYFWTEQYKELDFIANGDIVIVRRVRRIRELYGFRFADVTFTFPDYDDFELETNVLLDTLHSDFPALSKEQSDKLFTLVLEDYADITIKSERMKKMKVDPYYNALQVKYAYAITCHKAQGGQWKRVFIDQGYMTVDSLTPDYFRWLYTAFTRSTEVVYLVNFPKEQCV